MKKLLLLLAVCSAASAIDIFMPPRDGAACGIIGISGATPALVTVDDMSKCNLANDDKVAIWGAWNDASQTTPVYSNINSHLENSSDYPNYCRTVKEVSGDTFKVYDCAGTTALTNSGTDSTWEVGGRVMKGSSLTRNSSPFLLNSTQLACLSDTSASGCANAARVEYNALGAESTPDYTKKANVRTGVGVERAVLRWFAAGAPGSGTTFDNVVNALTLGTAYLWPHFAYSSAYSSDGGWPVSEYGDYNVEVYMPGHVRMIDAAKSTLSGAAKTTFLRRMFDDFSWTRGGFNYTGTTLTNQTFKTVTGTCSVTNGSTNVHGTGTSFTTEVSVGDWIQCGTPNYTWVLEVVSIIDNDDLTTNLPPFSDSSGTMLVSSPWVEGSHVGYLNMASQNTYSTVCSAPYSDITSLSGWKCPGYNGTKDSGGFEAYHNHNMGRVVPLFMLGVVLADEDPRAAWLASTSAFIWQDLYQGPVWNFGGDTHASGSYSNGRIVPYMMMMYGTLERAFGVDYLGGGTQSTNWWDNWAKYALARNPLGTIDAVKERTFAAGGEQADWGCCADFARAGLEYLYWKPNGTYAAAVKQMLGTDQSLLYTQGTLNQNDGPMIGLAYMAMQPSITAARGSQTSFMAEPNRAACLAYQPAAHCPNDQFFTAWSRAGSSTNEIWDQTGTILRFTAWAGNKWDHIGQRPDGGPIVAINSRWMLGGDYVDAGQQEPITGSNFFVGTDSNIQTDCSVRGQTCYTSRVAKHASTTALGMVTEHAGQYIAGSNVTSATRAQWHIKPSGSHGFVVIQDQYTSSSALTPYNYSHYYVNDLGQTPSSAASISLSRASCTLVQTKTNARVSTKWLNGTCSTEANSDTNGSYTGGANYAFRVKQSGSSGTSGTLRTVHMLGKNTSEAFPTTVEQDVGAFHVIELKRATYPVVAVLAGNNVTNQTGVSAFTTTHADSAQYLFYGLAAGTYDIGNGSTVCNDVVVLAGQHTAECLMAAGSITVVSDTPASPVDITTTSLGNGAVGASYSASLTITGGTPAYSCSVTVGTLPTGLSLSSGGAFSGTPTAFGSSTFTVSCTDSLGATPDTAVLTIVVAPKAGTAVRGAATRGGFPR